MHATSDLASDVVGLYAELETLLDRIAAVDTTPATYGEVIAVADAHERAARRLGFLGLQRVLDATERDVTTVEHISLTTFLIERLRITDPGVRKKLIAALMPMRAMTGELLPPRYPHLAAAWAKGAIGPGHVLAVLAVLDKIPAAIAAEVTAKAERDFAVFARQSTPSELTALGARLLAHLDPDGNLTDDADRARHRGLQLSRQDAQLMAKLTADLDPMAAALLAVVLDAWAAPGMNMPDDPDSPQGGHDDADVDVEKLKAAAERDGRSQAQRNHDALKALLQAAVDGALLGKSHRGLPPHLIVKITDAELRERAGIGETASGMMLPISDVLELAARAEQHLAVFADHRAEVLYFGTTKRFATRAQRFALFARDGAGCTHPECRQVFTRTQAHHADQDWADGGDTDITNLAAACGPHNRAVGTKPGQYTTRIIKHGPDAGHTAWQRNSSNGLPPLPQRVNRTLLAAETFARHLRNGGRLGDAVTSSPTIRSDPSTGPPPRDERRRTPRLISQGYTVNDLTLDDLR